MSESHPTFTAKEIASAELPVVISGLGRSSQRIGFVIVCDGKPLRETKHGWELSTADQCSVYKLYRKAHRRKARIVLNNELKDIAIGNVLIRSIDTARTIYHSHISHTYLKCDACGVVVKLYNSYAKRKGHKFCSRKCYLKFYTKNPQIVFNGVTYRFDPVTGYYQSDTQKLHREVWKYHYGEIPKNHIIHHINNISTDNRIENLQCLEWGEHTALHNTGKSRRKSKKGDFQ